MNSRCIMQIHGPTMEHLSNTKRQLEIEMNSSTDNPLVFEDGMPPLPIIRFFELIADSCMNVNRCM